MPSDEQIVPVKAGVLQAKARELKATGGTAGRPFPPAPHERCSHGVMYDGMDCRECSVVWHTEMLAKAEASVAQHKAALARLGAQSKEPPDA